MSQGPVPLRPRFSPGVPLSMDAGTEISRGPAVVNTAAGAFEAETSWLAGTPRWRPPTLPWHCGIGGSDHHDNRIVRSVTSRSGRSRYAATMSCSSVSHRACVALALLLMPVPVFAQSTSDSRVQVAAGGGFMTSGTYFTGPAGLELGGDDAFAGSLQASVPVHRSLRIVVAGS